MHSPFPFFPMSVELEAGVCRSDRHREGKHGRKEVPADLCGAWVQEVPVFRRDAFEQGSRTSHEVHAGHRHDKHAEEDDRRMEEVHVGDSLEPRAGQHPEQNADGHDERHDVHLQHLREQRRTCLDLRRAHEHEGYEDDDGDQDARLAVETPAERFRNGHDARLARLGEEPGQNHHEQKGAEAAARKYPDRRYSLVVAPLGRARRRRRRYDLAEQQNDQHAERQLVLGDHEFTGTAAPLREHEPDDAGDGNVDENQKQ